MIVNCHFCGGPKEVTRAQSHYPQACFKCFHKTCPKCGHDAYFVHTKNRPNGLHLCFALDCSWQEDAPAAPADPNPQPDTSTLNRDGE